MSYSLCEPDISTFLNQWFGNGEFQFGLKRGVRCQNVDEIKRFMYRSRLSGEPAFHSVQPRLRIEKVFWEFDTKLEAKKFTYDSPLLDSVWDQAHKLATKITQLGAKPLLVYSGNRGFHVWVFMQSEKVFAYEEKDFYKKGTTEIDYIKKVLIGSAYKGVLMAVLGNLKDYPNFDRMPTNINSMARIPFSWHQKSDNQCVPLTMDRKPYIPNLVDIISKPLPKSLVDSWIISLEGIEDTDDYKRFRDRKLKSLEIKDWNIRESIKSALSKNATHYVRLAFLLDAIYAGWSDEQIHDAMKSVSDKYDPQLTQYQISHTRTQVELTGVLPISSRKLIEWGIKKENVFLKKKTLDISRVLKSSTVKNAVE